MIARTRTSSKAGGFASAIRVPRSAFIDGFTLIELLVVIAIIAALIGILIPAVVAARRAGEASATHQLMVGIAMAIEVYENDTSLGAAYPPSSIETSDPRTFGLPGSAMSGWDGSQIITQAMLGWGSEAQDGKAGLGFRKTGTSGRVYGPYVEPANHEIKDNGSTKEFADQWGRAVQYFKASGGSFNGNHNDGNPNFSDPSNIDETSLNASAFCLYSRGPDLIEDTDDDIFVLAP